MLFSLNIYVSNDMMQDIQDLKNAQAGGDTIPPKTDTTPTTDNVGPRPNDPVQGRRWDNKYGGKYDPETGDKLPEKDDGEEDMLDMAFEPKKNSRLSCQLTVSDELDGLVVNIPSKQA